MNARKGFGKVSNRLRAPPPQSPPEPEILLLCSLPPETHQLDLLGVHNFGPAHAGELRRQRPVLRQVIVYRPVLLGGGLHQLVELRPVESPLGELDTQAADLRGHEGSEVQTSLRVYGFRVEG